MRQAKGNTAFSPGGSLPILTVIEAHIRYILPLLDRVRADRIALTPDPDRAAELLAQVRERAKQTVWYTGGCQSWYLDRNGVPIVAPMTLPMLRAEMREPVWSDFISIPLAPAEAAI